jgi:osmoprotectant transport system ATP-binding protein
VAGDAQLLPVRPLRDGDSLLSALNESVASPAGLVARVDADGVLTGVSAREVIHDKAGEWHGSAATGTGPEPAGSATDTATTPLKGGTS